MMTRDYENWQRIVRKDCKEAMEWIDKFLEEHPGLEAPVVELYLNTRRFYEISLEAGRYGGGIA